MFLLIFILILVALIWVHELGHFSVAKLFGVRVDEFAIGFPPRLISKKVGETLYSLNLILVGGYVSIFGEQAGDPSTSSGQDPRSLANKNRGIQAAVLLAGIAFNLLFAWLALSAGYINGIETAVGSESFGAVTESHPVIGGVYPDSPAGKAGLMAGDVIEKLQSAHSALDTRTLNTDRQSDAVRSFINDHQDESLVLTVLRAGEEKTFLAKPAEGIVTERKVIGIEMADVGVLKLPPHLALLQGAVSAKDLTVATAEGLWNFFGSLFLGHADLSQVSGPIGIAGIGAQAVKEGFAAAAMLTALISINLALINLVPIPGLDGGRLLIVAIEALIRRPVPVRVANTLTLAGFALLVALMVLVSVHDISRLVG